MSGLLLRHFYPRSPCGERPEKQHTGGKSRIFLSTLSLRRATISTRARSRTMRNFYPRSPCGERRCSKTHDRHKTIISIHALLAESDARRASRQQPAGISIHALLAESDYRRTVSLTAFCRFLSTLSLRRATPARPTANTGATKFLSTLSLRRATKIPYQRQIDQKNFYPRSPCGERPNSRRPIFDY